MKKLLMLVAAIIIIGITGIVGPRVVYIPDELCDSQIETIGYEKTCKLHPNCCQFIPPVEGEYGLIEID